MRIRRLVLRNVQIYEEADVSFDSHLNVLVGPSNSGKSTVIRALSYLFRGTPPVKHLIRHGADSLYLRVETEEHVIEREKSKNTNVVRLDGEEYRGFGRELPEEVRRALHITGDEEFFCAQQFDPPFMLSLSSVERGRMLSTLGGDVVKLDLATSALASEFRDLRRRQSDLSERASSLREELEKLEFVDRVEALMAEVKQEFSVLEKQRSLLTRLKELHTEIERLRGLVEHLSALLEETEPPNLEVFASLAERLVRIKLLESQRQRLVRNVERGELLLENIPEIDVESFSLALSSLTRLRSLLLRKRTVLAELERIELPHPDVDIPSLERLASRLSAIKRASHLRQLVSMLESKKREVERRIELLRREAEQVFEGRCPTCLQPVSVDHLLEGVS